MLAGIFESIISAKLEKSPDIGNPIRVNRRHNEHQSIIRQRCTLNSILIAVNLFAGMCWLPVVWLQIRMQKLAQSAYLQQQTQLPAQYWQYARYWEALSYPAFVAMLVVFYLMVNKPSLWL